MKAILRLLAFVVAILVVTLLLVGQVGLTAQTTLLSPVFLEQVLVRYEVYDRLPEMLVDMLFEQMTQPSSGEESTGMVIAAEIEEKFGRQAIIDFFRELLPPAWVQQEVERNIEAVFAFLRGDLAYPNTWLDLSDIGDWLTSEEGKEAVRMLLARLSPCEPEEDVFVEGEYFPHCRPPDPDLDEVMGEALPIVREELPGEPPFRPLTRADFSADALEGLAGVQRVYQTFSLGTLVVWLACLVLLGLILLLAARSLDQVLVWVGWPLLVAGGLFGVVMGIAFALAPTLLIGWLRQRLTDTSLPLALAEFGYEFLQGVAQSVIGRGLAIAALLALVGLVGLIAGALIRRARRSSLA